MNSKEKQPVNPQTDFKKIKDYKNYGKVLSLSNGVIEALVTVDVGPRIIRFGFVDGQNIMCDNRSVMAPKEDREKTAENIAKVRFFIDTLLA